MIGKPKKKQDVGKMLLRALKSCQEWPKWCPRALQDRPKRCQHASRTASGAPEMPPRPLQRHPRCLQDRPRGAQDAPKTAPRAPKRLPRPPREPPRACRTAQKPPSWLQDGPKSAFKCIQEEPKSLHKMQLAAQTAVQLLSRKQNPSIRPSHNASYH